MLALSYPQELTRLVIALALGALIGWEREATGKDAGIRTAMLVAGGASLFTMIDILMPGILRVNTTQFPVFSDRIISNIVVGIGFLGGGLILKSGEHAKGLTTAAIVWTTAAIGVLVGLGLTALAATAAMLITALMYTLRKMKLYEHIRPGQKVENGNGNGH